MILTHCTPDDTLTFAEAMALDPSEVEFTTPTGGNWMRLDGYLGCSLEHMRLNRFRRSRPKRSVIEKMADAKVEGDVTISERLCFKAGLETAIRAVCEWLRDGTVEDEGRATRIERHFLEKR